MIDLNPFPPLDVPARPTCFEAPYLVRVVARPVAEIKYAARDEEGGTIRHYAAQSRDYGGARHVPRDPEGGTELGQAQNLQVQV
jgi:hypothetical protein